MASTDGTPPPTPDGQPDARRLPALIQGGMGIGVSDWRLARAVSRAGGLGVVSGTALDRVMAYRLQEGDADGEVRRILARFPFPEIAERLVARWFVPGGVASPGAYRQTPLVGHQPGQDSLELLVAAGFAEIALAKDGHRGAVGINLLEKVQAPNLATLYGALLAGVDAVLMGAGIPHEIPAALARLAGHHEATLRLHVEGAQPGESTLLRFDPARLAGPGPRPALALPCFLAVISSDTLAQSLLRSTGGRVDGFVVEGPTAGGHNAPPRNHAAGLSARGEPVYGPRDQADLARLQRLGRPFWLAGGFGADGGLARARALGAHGVQLGTPFAFSADSGLTPALRAQVLEQVRTGAVQVFTDPLASPTGFPFKVVELPGSLSEAAVYAARTRVCNLGYLRQAFRREDGTIGWRCAAEPEERFLAQGGDPAALAGRKCLCNALMAAAGFALATADGGREPPLVTAGDSLAELGRGGCAAPGGGAGELCARLAAEPEPPAG